MDALQGKARIQRRFQLHDSQIEQIPRIDASGHDRCGHAGPADRVAYACACPPHQPVPQAIRKYSDQQSDQAGFDRTQEPEMQWQVHVRRTGLDEILAMALSMRKSKAKAIGLEKV